MAMNDNQNSTHSTTASHQGMQSGRPNEGRDIVEKIAQYWPRFSAQQKDIIELALADREGRATPKQISKGLIAINRVYSCGDSQYVISIMRDANLRNLEGQLEDWIDGIEKSEEAQREIATHMRAPARTTNDNLWVEGFFWGGITVAAIFMVAACAKGDK